MTFRFSLHGVAGHFDLPRMIRGNRRYQQTRNRMINELNIPEARADRILEDMLGNALLRHGDHLLTVKGAIVDRVVQIRSELDTLFGTVLEFNPRNNADGSAGSRASLDEQIRQLDQHYSDLDQALQDLGIPFHEMQPPPAVADGVHPAFRQEIDGVTPMTQRQADRPIEYDTSRPPPETGLGQRIRIETGRYTFSRNVLPDGRVQWTRSFEDGASVRFEVEGGRYRVETYDASGRRTHEFGEYDILHDAYRTRPRTTAIMQAHHGMQNSLMKQLFEDFGYDGNAVPTIWLRNSRRGSPHGIITDIQNASKPSRAADAVNNPRAAGQAAPGAAPLEARGLAGTTYADIRRWALADLLMTDMPRNRIDEYLAVFDRYFERNVLPNIPADQRAALLGNWPPAGGGQ